MSKKTKFVGSCDDGDALEVATWAASYGTRVKKIKFDRLDERVIVAYTGPTPTEDEMRDWVNE